MVNERSKCDVCGKEVKHLNKHRKRMHAVAGSIEAFECTECGYRTNRKYNFERHVGTAHGAKPRKCIICKEEFRYNFELRNHRRLVHCVKSKLSLGCSLCKVYVNNLKQFRGHFVMRHEATLENHEFSTKCEFETWKRQEERKNICRYIKMRSRCVGKGDTKKTVTTFMCHRSGYCFRKNKSTESGKKMPMRKKSCKTGITCPSHMVCTITGNSVVVTYVPQHMFHKKEVCHMRLDVEDMKKIYEDVEKEIPYHHILQNIRQKVVPGQEISRFDVVDRQDIRNIVQKYALCKGNRLHKNDITSVLMWVKCMETSPDNPVILFKEPGKDGEPLRNEDFVLVLMMPEQKEILRKYGHDKVCIDSTHGTNRYDFQLTTLMVVDEFGEGVVGSFCISNKVDIVIMKEFFIAVKENFGLISAKYFMSDDDAKFFNAWQVVMGEVQRKLLCTWHVDRCWKKQSLQKVRCNKKRKTEKATQIYKVLHALNMEMKEDAFQTMLQNFITMLREDKDTIDFAEYFVSYYAHRPEQWALCYRKCAGINTNMILEAFHRLLKYTYFQGIRNKRLDALIPALLGVVRDKLFGQALKRLRPKANYHVGLINARHKRGLEIDASRIVAESEMRWKVKSRKNSKEYVVEYVTSTCSRCELTCSECKVCWHMYCCECIDYQIQSNLCKHIHAVVLAYKQMDVDDGVILNVEVDAAEILQLPSTSSNVSVSKPVDVLQQKALHLVHLLQKQEMREISPDIAASIGKNIENCIQLLNNHLSNESCSVVNVVDNTPANTKVQKQSQWIYKKKPTRKQRSAPNEAMEEDAMREQLLGSHEGVLYIHSSFDHTYAAVE